MLGPSGEKSEADARFSARAARDARLRPALIHLFPSGRLSNYTLTEVCFNGPVYTSPKRRGSTRSRFRGSTQVIGGTNSTNLSTYIRTCSAAGMPVLRSGASKV